MGWQFKPTLDVCWYQEKLCKQRAIFEYMFRSKDSKVITVGIPNLPRDVSGYKAMIKVNIRLGLYATGVQRALD